jgi:hypothetical protein
MATVEELAARAVRVASDNAGDARLATERGRR